MIENHNYKLIVRWDGKQQIYSGTGTSRMGFIGSFFRDFLQDKPNISGFKVEIIDMDLQEKQIREAKREGKNDK